MSDLKALGPLAFKPKHTCKQDDLQNRKRAAEKKQYVDFITRWDEVRLHSIHYLAYIVCQRIGLHRDIYMYAIDLEAIEETYLRPWIVNSLPTNLGKIYKIHSAYRALVNKEENSD